MKRYLLMVALIILVAGLKAQFPHHVIHTVIDHSVNGISVTDTIYFPEAFFVTVDALEFTLNRHLTLDKPGRGISIETLKGNGEDGPVRYRVAISPGIKKTGIMVLTYRGRIEDEIVTGAAEYARGFSETDGIICRDGIYLAGSSNWLPDLEGTDLFTFNLTVDLDGSWNVVSQGTRTVNALHGDRRTVRYDAQDPVDEVYLVAGQWTEYSVRSGSVLVQAFLRTPDEELANRYLGVTSSYLALYKELIGAYPYTKFALVENFWETGYGMPSFTLLGEKVIRFPWILHSSYPHELLHNYWGNSVYVDYNRGNWCEGITAYMADHLIKEQQGLADDYRRTTLQKFTDYVNAENDFPPAVFTSRHNPAEEAIGYGKVMMFNNMLRDEFGDEAFIRAYADFYKRNRFRYASFDDIRASFERVTSSDLRGMFDQWINRKGTPSIRLENVEVSASEDGYELSWTLRQVHEGESYKLTVPIAIYLENEEEVLIKRVSLDQPENTFAVRVANRPLKVSVDPQYNLMRRLHYSEVPATFSQIFGATKAAIILPGEGGNREKYQAAAEFWKETQAAQGKELTVLYDNEVEEIPSGICAWVVGFENRYYDRMKINPTMLDGLSEADREKMQELAAGQTLVYAMPAPGDPGQTIGFLGTHFPDDVIALARKLMHYGGYGYLGFEGAEFTNTLKGVFPVLNSAMDFIIPYEDHPVIDQKLQSRKALSYAGSGSGNAVKEPEGEQMQVWKVPNVDQGAEAYFSPDSRSLIFNGKIGTDETFYVYTVNIDGSDLKKINDRGEDACSFYHPAGGKLIWTSTRDHADLHSGNFSDPKDYPQGAEIYVSDLDGGDVVRLTDNEYYDAEVSYSPDGSKILFGRQINGEMDLWVMDPDGNNQRQITFTPEWQEGGAFYMNDNETIILRAWKKSDEGQRGLPMTLFTIKDDGTERRPITSDEGTNWAPFPSRDGRFIAYVKVLPPHNYEIFLRELETGEEIRLTNNDAFDGFPAISPDGKTLSFSSSRGAGEGNRSLTLYLMDISSLGL